LKRGNIDRHEKLEKIEQVLTTMINEGKIMEYEEELIDKLEFL
jgi:hypothetical protein